MCFNPLSLLRAPKPLNYLSLLTHICRPLNPLNLYQFLQIYLINLLESCHVVSHQYAHTARSPETWHRTCEHRVGHPFFSKECSVLSVLFRSFQKNIPFFPFFYILFKRTFRSFCSFTFFSKERNVLFTFFS